MLNGPYRPALLIRPIIPFPVLNFLQPLGSQYRHLAEVAYIAVKSGGRAREVRPFAATFIGAFSLPSAFGRSMEPYISHPPNEMGSVSLAPARLRDSALC